MFVTSVGEITCGKQVASSASKTPILSGRAKGEKITRQVRNPAE
jgi:hypothetical protein